MILKAIIASLLLVALVLLRPVGCASLERALLFHPTHRPHNNSLTPWTSNDEIIGYARKLAAPSNVWLLLHGNAGQAADRLYALPSFATADAIFILEYPGYGSRAGVPSREAFNQAAQQAYLLLRATYPHIPICVAAESIGSGPASFLATLSPPPDKIVLIVPFDKLSLVANDYFPPLLVDLILQNDWDNVAALMHYQGPVEIFGAEGDTIIPVKHAKALGAALPRAKMTIISGGHNDWSYQGRVTIRNP